MPSQESSKHDQTAHARTAPTMKRSRVMRPRHMILSILFGAVLVITGCSDDDGGTGDDDDSGASGSGASGSGGSGTGGTSASGGNSGGGGTAAVDCTSDIGACCSICGGGTLMCVVDGVDPGTGIDSCVTDCRAQWPNEQSCGSAANFVLQCVDANASCDTLTTETCGDFPSSALGLLLACLGA